VRMLLLNKSFLTGLTGLPPFSPVSPKRHFETGPNQLTLLSRRGNSIF
jgi:hypothetical protein